MRAISIGAVCLFLGAACWAEELSDGEIARLFHDMLALRGSQYIEKRDRFVSSPEHALRFLERRADAVAADGKERLLAEILMEWLFLKETDRKRLFAPMTYQLGRENDGVQKAQSEIAERFNRHSLLLLEALQNGNEVNSIQHSVYASSILGREPYRTMVIVRALGDLGEKRAMWLFVEMLRQDSSGPLAEQVAFTLGRVASPAALEALTQIINVASPPVVDILLEILPKFIDKNSVPVLDRAVSKTGSKKCLETYKGLIRVIEVKALAASAAREATERKQPAQQVGNGGDTGLWDEYVRRTPRLLSVPWDVIPNTWVVKCGKLEPHAAACLCVLANQGVGDFVGEFPLTVDDFFRFARQLKNDTELTAAERIELEALYRQARDGYAGFLAKDPDKFAGMLNEMLSKGKLQDGWLGLLRQMGLQSEREWGDVPRFDTVAKAIHRGIPPIIVEKDVCSVVIGYIAKRAANGSELNYIVVVRPRLIDAQADGGAGSSHMLAGFPGRRIATTDPLPQGVTIEPFDRERYTWFFFHNIQRGVASWKNEILAIVRK